VNRAELKAACGTLFHRPTDEYFDTALILAEARIAQDIRGRDMVVYATIDTSTVPVAENTWPLPADFLKAREVRPVGAGLPLDPAGRDELADRRTRGSVGSSAYSVYSQRIEFQPGPGEVEIGLIYFGRLAPLVADTDSNALLTNWPGAYIWAVMIELHIWEEDYEAAEAKGTLFRGQVKAINKQAQEAQYGPGVAKYSGNNYQAAPARS